MLIIAFVQLFFIQIKTSPSTIDQCFQTMLVLESTALWINTLINNNNLQEKEMQIITSILTAMNGQQTLTEEIKTKVKNFCLSYNDIGTSLEQYKCLNNQNYIADKETIEKYYMDKMELIQTSMTPNPNTDPNVLSICLSFHDPVFKSKSLYFTSNVSVDLSVISSCFASLLSMTE